MRCVQSPEIYVPSLHKLDATLFMAGGITGCSDWQADMLSRLKAEDSRLKDADLIVFNPRRREFNMDTAGGDEGYKQIKWEFQHLRNSYAILFWFPAETLCPITLFELGAWSTDSRIPLFVGTDPAYARKYDVVTQLQLARPDVKVVHSLSDLAQQVVLFFGTMPEVCHG